MKKNKKLLASILATFALSAVGGAVLCSNASAIKADASSASTSYLQWDGEEMSQQFNVAGNAEKISFYTSTGASIRYTEPTGIRFSCSVAKEDYARLTEKYGAGSVQFGTLITQKEVLGSNELTHEAGVTKMDALSTNNSLNDDKDTNDDVFQFNAVVKNMNAVNYAKEYVARSYVKITVEGTSYYAYNEFDGAKHSRSVKSVAMDALVDDSEEISSERQNILRGFIGEDNLGAEDVNLKAVTYELQGGEGKSKSGFLTAEGLTTLATPYKVGYTFDGWYDSQDHLVTSIPTGSDDVTLTAKWTEKAQALNAFEDYASSASLASITMGAAYGIEEPVWLSEFEGATGVVKTHSSNGYTPQYGLSKVAAVFPSFTEDQIKAIDFDYVDIRMYLDGDRTEYIVKSQNLALATVPNGEWVTVRMTKDMINSKSPSSHYVNDTTTNQGMPHFAKVHANGSDKHGEHLFIVELIGDVPQGYSTWNEYKAANADAYKDLTAATKGVTVYLDAVSFGEFEVAEHGAMTKGAPFTIPAITMKGVGGVAIPAEYTATVSYGGTDVTVTENTFTPTKAGAYVITYTVNYNDVAYTYEYTVSLVRQVAAGYLDDFADEDCVESVYIGTANGKVEKAGEWLTEYTVGSSETKTRQGVLKVALPKSGNNYLWYSLPQTVAQLEAMNIKDITINYAVEREDGGLPPSGWCAMHMDTNTNVSVGINSGNWRTTTITLEKLKSIARYQKADGSMDWTALSCEGSDSWFLRSAATDNITLYFDSITYTVNE